MRVSNFLPGLMILALSAAIFLETRDLAYWSDTTPGPGFFPHLVVIAGIALFVVQFGEAWRTGAREVAEWPDRHGLARAGLAFSGLVAFAVLTPLLGMVPCIALLLLFLLLVVLRQSLLPSLATSAITLGVVYGVFIHWLGISVPTGPFGI